MTGVAAAFLSYSREDDRTSQGRISALARAVCDEFSLITGRELELFIDRESIEWGDAWRARIDEALDTSTIFIPVVTPRYFTRPECRKEFLDFYGPAAASNATKLIMPVRFAALADFNNDNPDQLIATASSFHYSDWVDLRLTDVASEKVLRAINEMATKIESALSEVQNSVAALPVATADVPDDAGVIDVLESLRIMLPEWLNAVQENELLIEQAEAVNRTILKRMARARESQWISLVHQEAKSEEPIARRMLELAQFYYARTVELHPLVTSMIRLIREYPEHVDLIAGLRSAVAEAIDQIEAWRAKQATPDFLDGEDYWGRVEHLGRLMKELKTLISEAGRYRVEANALVESWAAEMAELGA